MNDCPSIAVIGAGVAGLACAWRLRECAASVSVFEKSRGVSGRAASRTRHGARIDIGANYLKVESPDVARLLDEVMGGEMGSIERGVWVFNGDGQLRAGDPAQNSDARLTHADGISTLGKCLARAGGAAIYLQRRVVGLTRDHDRWRLVMEGGEGSAAGPFDAVVLTAPAPQTASLLTASELPPALLGSLSEALSAAAYHRQFCFALGFDRWLPRPFDCHAMINTDRAHDIAWLSYEEDKPGRELNGGSVVSVQMSPAWSAERFEEPPETLRAQAVAAARELLGDALPEPAWTEGQRWRYAHPYSAADAALLSLGTPHGLYFAGDYLVGKGRLGAAMETGLVAARQVIDRLAL